MTDFTRLNFQHLLYLQALVEERHVTRAADRVGIGQPAMSAALSKLRAVFNDVLLVKTSTGMEPTPRAIELVKRIRDISDLLEGKTGQASSFDAATAQTHWRIMASEGISKVLLPRLMSVAEREAPQMRFTVHPGDPRRLSEYLRDGVFDICLAFVRRPPEDLRQMVLYPQKLVVIGRAGHSAFDGGLSLDSFVQADHVRWGAPPVIHASMEAMVDEALELKGLRRHIRLLVSSITLLPDIVAQTNMLAVIPAQMAASIQQSLAIQTAPLPVDVEAVDVSMLWHERQHGDIAHKWLRGALREVGRISALSMPRE